MTYVIYPKWLTMGLHADIIHMENVAMEATTTAVDKPKTASWTGTLVEGRDFLEQPIVAASAIDRFVELAGKPRLLGTMGSCLSQSHRSIGVPCG
jgi:hypothetical protein